MISPFLLSSFSTIWKKSLITINQSNLSYENRIFFAKTGMRVFTHMIDMKNMYTVKFSDWSIYIGLLCDNHIVDSARFINQNSGLFMSSKQNKIKYQL